MKEAAGVVSGAGVCTLDCIQLANNNIDCCACAACAAATARPCSRSCWSSAALAVSLSRRLPSSAALISVAAALSNFFISSWCFIESL